MEEIEKSSLGFASREKYWTELTADEKIERMRQVFKAKEDLIRRLESRVEKLLIHSHSDGQISVPLRDNVFFGEVLGGGLRYEDKYF